MNNKFGKLFDKIIAQQNEFMELVKSKKFFILQQATPAAAPSGKAQAASAAPAPSGTTPAVAAPSGTTQAAPAASAPSGATPAAAAPFGTTQATPAAPTKPVDPVDDEDVKELRATFIECGTAITSKTEQFFMQQFNKWYTEKKRVLIIYKNKSGKPVVKKLPLTTFNKDKRRWLKFAQKNNKASEDNTSYLNDEDVIEYKPYAIQLLQLANPRLTPARAEKRFIIRVKSKKTIPVVENGEIDLNKNIEQFLDNPEFYEDNASEYIEKHKAQIDAAAAKKQQEAATKQAEDDKKAADKNIRAKLKEFETDARKLANSLNIQELASACDVDNMRGADLYLQPCNMYNIKGDQVASWDNGNEEIDSGKEVRKLIDFLTNKEVNDLPNHPSCYYYVLYSLTHNDDFAELSESQQAAINKIYDQPLRDIKEIMDKYSEFCAKGFNAQTGACNYKNLFE